MARFFSILWDKIEALTLQQKDALPVAREYANGKLSRDTPSEFAVLVIRPIMY